MYKYILNKNFLFFWMYNILMNLGKRSYFFVIFNVIGIYVVVWFNVNKVEIWSYFYKLDFINIFIIVFYKIFTIIVCII